MHGTIISLACLLLSALTPTTSFAQDSFDPDAARSIAQGDFAAAPVTRCLSGFLTDNFRRDVLALHGSTPILLHSPGTYQALIAYEDRNANDIALTQKTSGRFALVGPSGLSFVRYEQDGFTTQDHPCTALVDATRVLVADLDGDGVEGVTALDASGTQLILVPNAATTGTAFTTVNLSSPALAIAAADLRDDLASEIVVVHATETLLLSGTGAVLETHPSVPLGSAILVPFRQVGHPKERMAMVARPTAGTYDFVVVLTTRPDSMVDAGPASVFAATAGNADAGADQDLVLLSRTHDDAIVLFNQAGGGPPSEDPTFVDSDLDVVGFLGSFGTQEEPEAVCADFDADGDDDLLLLDAEQGSFAILPGVQCSPAPQRISLLDQVESYFVLWEARQEAELQFGYDLPSEALAGATDVEFTVWRLPKQSDVLESDALVCAYQSLGEHAQGSNVKLEIQNASLGLDDTYVLEARLVQRVGGSVVAAGPTWSGSFRPSAKYSELLAEDPPEIEAIPVFVVPEDSSTTSYSGNHPGSDPEFDNFREEDSGLIPLPGLPPHDDEPQNPPLGS